MYILPHLCVAKDFWSFKILDQIDFEERLATIYSKPIPL